MNQYSVTPARPASRAPVFFWITVGLLAMLLLGGVAASLLAVLDARNINRSGGLGMAPGRRPLRGGKHRGLCGVRTVCDCFAIQI
jgi:hypothetical protein